MTRAAFEAHFADFPMILRKAELVEFDSFGCWVIPNNSRTGYATALLSKEPRRVQHVHRVSLAIATGRDLAPGECACHVCDNPPCVNPAHLFLGTHAQNMADMAAKGRADRAKKLRGDACPWSSHTKAEVVEALRSAAAGESWSSIARRMGVSKTSVGRWISGRNRADAYAEFHAYDAAQDGAA